MGNSNSGPKAPYLNGWSHDILLRREFPLRRGHGVAQARQHLERGSKPPAGVMRFGSCQRLAHQQKNDGCAPATLDRQNITTAEG